MLTLMINMEMMMIDRIRDGQAPVDCEVFGQSESRNPYAMAFLFIVGVVIAIALVAW